MTAARGDNSDADLVRDPTGSRRIWVRDRIGAAVDEQEPMAGAAV
jgi:hypothetical protein